MAVTSELDAYNTPTPFRLAKVDDLTLSSGGNWPRSHPRKRFKRGVRPGVSSPEMQKTDSSAPVNGERTQLKKLSPEQTALNDRLLELVDRLRSGEERAFDELVPLAGRMAYHLALRSVSDPNIAEDIAQEALFRLYKHVHEIQGVGAFKTWFYRIVLNLVHDHYRKHGRQENAMSNLEEFRKSQEKARSDPLTRLEREGLNAALQNALESLDEKHREVFLLKEVEGLGHGEIAQLLGVPTGTVWSRLSYARKRLQERLLREGFMP